MKQMMTPWGKSQTVKECGRGILLVETAGHGGYFVPNELLKRIPLVEREYAKAWSGSENWYEEDCAAAIVMYRFPRVAPQITFDEIKKYYESVKTYWA
jgi:hypothetical protein